MKSRRILGEKDAYIAFSSGTIAVIDGVVTWIRRDYPDYGGALSDVKRKADAGKLRIGTDGIYEEEAHA
ncbi:hypothetical protein [uncultured Paenibacillus sp.]|uniref:hypothetical protein n=1 Tax=uncultured Paenibacillus sp. TaxID=227322 RepID=UPI0015B1C492|nr:hypothetical protein [uncultured Paenibacillus sp.]DAW22618.1 MAG TPA: hypothetical protein [Caudoviricetes sp.]